MKVFCNQCGAELDKPANAVNRAQREGRLMFCNRVCFGLSRRLQVPRTEVERKARKKAYDAEYRIRDAETRKAKKAAYYRRTHNPERERVTRRARMHLHVEYCRRPEYRAWKSEYDRRLRATKNFGEFAEAFLLLQDIDREVGARASDYEIRTTNGTLNKAQKRRRAL